MRVIDPTIHQENSASPTSAVKICKKDPQKCFAVEGLNMYFFWYEGIGFVAHVAPDRESAPVGAED